MRSEHQVKEFMQLFQRDDVKSSPGFPDKKYLLLRFRLILEELLELAAANGSDGVTLFEIALQEYLDKCNYGTLGARSLNDAFDALLDLRYVVDGAIISHGMTKIFAEGFEEVHRSNMSKKCRDAAEATISIADYGKRGIKAMRSKYHDLVLLDAATGKTLKPLGYSPANLKPILDGTIQRADELEADH